jgi:hypothetical protein
VRRPVAIVGTLLLLAATAADAIDSPPEAVVEARARLVSEQPSPSSRNGTSAEARAVVVTVRYELPDGYYQSDTREFFAFSLFDGDATEKPITGGSESRITPVGDIEYPPHSIQGGWSGSVVLTRRYRVLGIENGEIKPTLVVHATYQLCGKDGLCYMPGRVESVARWQP